MQEQAISAPLIEKTMYVVNLDIQRIVILSGLLLTLLAGAFLAGSKWSATQKSTMSTDDSGLMLEEINTGIEEKQLSSALLAPSSEIITPFNNATNSLPIQKDPFISGPSLQTAEKKITKVQKKYHKQTNISYYTVQIAAFVKEKDANTLKKKLAASAITARVVRGRTLFLVRAGRSSKKEKLRSIKSKIVRAIGVAPIVVKSRI